jgi:hypothetical protein
VDTHDTDEANMSTQSQPSLPEAWLRGPVDGVSVALQPVAHALQQALEDAERAGRGLTDVEAWTSVGGAASPAFHLRHMAGSLDRLLTYARGSQLSDAQRAALAAERERAPHLTAAMLLDNLQAAITAALAQLRGTPDDMLDEARAVGRAGLPSTVRGLLYHAGEHAARHAGQLGTTVKILRARD